MIRFLPALACLWLLAAAAPLPAAEDPESPDEWLAVGPLPRSGRGPFGPDPVAARYILALPPVPPEKGETVPGIRDPWAVMEPDEKGWLRGTPLVNGYAYATVNCEQDGVLLLEGRGHYYVYVNGEPFPGDVYRKGRGPVPVPVRKGANHLFVRAVRGPFKLGWRRPPSPVLLPLEDNTLPDVREGETLSRFAGVRVVNASREPLEGAVLEAGGNGLFRKTTVAVPYLPPCASNKVPLPVALVAPVPLAEADRETRGKRTSTFVRLPVKLIAGTRPVEAELRLRYREAGQTWRDTFISEIDGSVQYYGVRPPARTIEGRGALYLSLHGASVKAFGLVNAYTPRPDGWVVAATNRRPFGFDWEDWGRMDAMEVLRTARKRFPVDPDRVYLTGHSMGGHGTWHVGVTHPGRFAALGPSAGWISFFSYGGARKMTGSGPQAILNRCMAGSDTLALKENYRTLPVFIIHGAADDNVPVRESRTMVQELETFHRDFVYREVPGKKHWWNDPETPGTDCVNLSDLFDFFARHVRPAAPRRLAFKTFNPGVSCERRWIRIEEQDRLLHLSAVNALAVPEDGRIEIETENVRRLSFDPAPLFRPGAITVRVDGDEVKTRWDGRSCVYLLEEEAAWREAGPAPATCKRPGRYGPFKAVFDRRFVLVYGTKGTAEENALARARARFDAGMWWYRANGACEILPDTHFDPARFRGRNVILYGHAEQNDAFKTLLPDAPVRVLRGRLVVGDRTLRGTDLALLMIRPSPLGEDNLVGVVGGTGPKGILATLRVSYLRSFVQFPDWIAFRWAVAETGTEGMEGLGLFGRRWELADGETWMKGEGEGEKGEEEGF